MKRISVLLVLVVLTLSVSALSQGKFSGYMFGDYYYNIGRDSSFGLPSTIHKAPGASAANGSVPGPKAMQAFQIRRIYFAYDNDISEQFTTRFRLEADQAATPGVTAPVATVTGTVDTTKRPPTVSGSSAAPGLDELVGGKVSVFVKDAYLTWKNIFPGSNLTFGIQPTAAFDISETAYGYRFIEKTIMDLRGIVPSRDLGISLKGKLVGDGMANYWVMIANSSGNAPESDKYKRYSANIQVKPITNFQATLYVDLKDAADITVTGSAKSNSTMIEALFLNYSVPFMYNFGVETFMSSQSNAFLATGATEPKSLSALGYSVWGSYNLMPELTAFLRYDSYDPNTDSDTKAKGDSRNLILAGLSWKADKNVSISPNIYYETYETPAAAGSASIDPSLSARLTLYYIFL